MHAIISWKICTWQGICFTTSFTRWNIFFACENKLWNFAWQEIWFTSLFHKVKVCFFLLVKIVGDNRLFRQSRMKSRKQIAFTCKHLVMVDICNHDLLIMYTTPDHRRLNLDALSKVGSMSLVGLSKYVWDGKYRWA